jgi:Ca2+-binding RTX toxin-like protein
MLTVKAIKETSQKQPTREDYVQEEKNKRSFLPLSFMLFLAGCAVYLKSFMPVRVDSSEVPAERSHPDADQERAPVNDTVTPEETIVTESSGRQKMSSDNVVPFPSSLGRQPQGSGFLASDKAALDFTQSKRSPLKPNTFQNDGALPVNDHSPPHKLEPPRPPKGGGGGGGGDDSDPHPELRNRAPRSSGPVQLPDLAGCQAYLISVLALLAGTIDADGDPLTIRNLSVSSGSLTRSEDGGWLYKAAQDMRGEVVLSYEITDGSATIQQLAYFRVVDAPPIIGTNGDDNLLGTLCADVIDARDGHDNIDAREGNDLILAGDGDDHVVAGSGNDIVHAGSGNDIVFAGAGNDIVFGGPGNDRLFGDQGDDILHGEDGDDQIWGGSGGDTLLAGAGDDVLEGEDGDDVLDGGAGNDLMRGGSGADKLFARAGQDTIFGNDGNDFISDGEGRDEVHGGDGDDYVEAAMDAADDVYSGDQGNDTLDYSSAVVRIVIDLGRGQADGMEIGKDLISGFEKVIAGQGDDYFRVGNGPMSMTGGAGNDTFEFKRADDDHQPDVVRKITDFTVGDRIIAASFEVRYRADGDAKEEVQDLFDDIYLHDNADRLPIRFRFEKIDNSDRTYVDVHDRPDPDVFYSIELNGHHNLEILASIS